MGGFSTCIVTTVGYKMMWRVENWLQFLPISEFYDFDNSDFPANLYKKRGKLAVKMITRLHGQSL